MKVSAASAVFVKLDEHEFTLTNEEALELRDALSAFLQPTVKYTYTPPAIDPIPKIGYPFDVTCAEGSR